MQKGAIEQVSKENVTGWIYSSEVKLNDLRILAFIDKECVGSGFISIYRPDLQGVGLGNGQLGFSINISAEEADISKLYIKFEGSDFLLTQSDAKIISYENDTGKLSKINKNEYLRELSSLKWKLRNEKIMQSSYDMFRMLAIFGLYERALPQTNDRPKIEVVESEITNFIEEFSQNDIKIIEKVLLSSEDNTNFLDSLIKSEKIIPIIAMVADEPVTMSALEGSHIDASFDVDRSTNEYVLSQKNILFINVNLDFKINKKNINEGLIRLFYAEYLN